MSGPPVIEAPSADLDMRQHTDSHTEPDTMDTRVQQQSQLEPTLVQHTYQTEPQVSN